MLCQNLIQHLFYVEIGGREQPRFDFFAQFGCDVCKINGRLTTVSDLKKFMANIIDIHGQNDNQSLLNVNTHIELLDAYSSKELKSLKKDYKKLYEEYLNIKSELNKNYGDDKEKQRKSALR